MTSQRVLVAFVALMVCMLAVSTSAVSPISQNAAVRRHASLIGARPARRSINLASGQMLKTKRQTADQIAQAAALKAWDDDFHAKNAEWQQAALASLAKGEIPLSFDQYWDGKDSSSSSGSTSASDTSAATPATGSDTSSTSDSTTGTNASSDTGTSSGSDDGTESNSTSSSSSSDDSATASSTTSSGNKKSCPASKNANSAGSDAPKQMAKAATTTSAASTSTSTSTSSSSSSSGATFSGQGTYFATGLGACGITNTDSDRIVAISHTLFDSFSTSSNPNNNPVCGHKIKATYNGKSTTVTVTDRCEGCAYGDLDFTTTAFQDLANLSLGRLNGLTWEWLGTAP